MKKRYEEREKMRSSSPLKRAEIKARIEDKDYDPKKAASYMARRKK